MAAFLLKTKYDSSYVPPPAAGIFGDVPAGDGFSAWIEQLYAEGVTGGCQVAPLLYCPLTPTRAGRWPCFWSRLSVSKRHLSYRLLTWVCLWWPARPWVEQLYAEGVTSGCQVSPLLYCPFNANTRGQMAVFLVRAFGL